MGSRPFIWQDPEKVYWLDAKWYAWVTHKTCYISFSLSLSLSLSLKVQETRNLSTQYFSFCVLVGVGQHPRTQSPEGCLSLWWGVGQRPTFCFGGEVRRAVQLCCRSDESRRHITKIPIHMEPPFQVATAFSFSLSLS